MDLQLTGGCAIVTGAAEGLGAAIAIYLASEGVCTAPGQQLGPEGIKSTFQGLVSAFPDRTARIEDVIAEKGRAAVRSLQATHRGVLFGIRQPASKSVLRCMSSTASTTAASATRHMEEWLGLFLQLGSFPTVPFNV